MKFGFQRRYQNLAIWLAKFPIAVKLDKGSMTALVTTLAIVLRLVTRYTCTLVTVVTVLTITGCL